MPAARLAARSGPAAATGASYGQAGFAVLGSANPATGGKGGTQAAGGDPGRNASDLSVTATAGSLGFGGNGAAGAASGGGGGGGGLYGGGGGGSSSSFSGGHGGGGSGFGPAETDFRAGVGVGFGRAKISYDRRVSLLAARSIRVDAHMVMTTFAAGVALAEVAEGLGRLAQLEASCR